MTEARVVVAVIVDGDRVWVQRRAESGPLDGAWEFPGGRVEPGEEPAEALRREVREETGAEVVVGELLDERRHDYGDRTVQLRFHAATLLDGATPTGGRWMAWSELAHAEIPAANRPLVDRMSAAP